MGAAHGRWRDDPSLHERSWQWVAELNPDVALLQECIPPAWASARWRVVNRPFKWWTSAVVARRDLDLAEYVVPSGGPLDRLGSYLSTATFGLAGGAELVLASVHTRAA